MSTKMKIIYSILLCLCISVFTVKSDEEFERVYDQRTSDIYERGYILDIQSSNGISKAFLTYDGGSARVLISSDDGKTWEKEFSDENPVRGEEILALKGGIFKNNITMLPLYYGYIYIQNGLGNQYQEIKVPTKEFNFYVDLSNNALLLASTQVLLQSKDLGNSWDTLKSFDRQRILDISVINDSIYAISTGMNDSNFYHVSFDKGHNWLSVRTEYYYNKMCFIDSIGWACTAKKTGNGDQAKDAIFKTSNYGKKWTKIYEQENWKIFGLRDIDFFNLNVGIATGMAGKILVTKDGGVSWEQKIIDEDEIFDMDVMCSGFSSNGKMLIGATDFGIYRSPYPGTVLQKYEQFSLSPNPAGDFIMISISGTNPTLKHEVDETSEVSIFNTLCEKVMSVETLHATSLQIDISNLPKGMYFVKIGDGVSKFVKM